MGFFEENPIVFVVAVIVIAETWIRVREPLFRGLTRRKQRP